MKLLKEKARATDAASTSAASASALHVVSANSLNLAQLHQEFFKIVIATSMDNNFS